MTTETDFTEKLDLIIGDEEGQIQILQEENAPESEITEQEHFVKELQACTNWTTLETVLTAHNRTLNSYDDPPTWLLDDLDDEVGKLGAEFIGRLAEQGE